jgi:hypothetical protein
MEKSGHPYKKKKSFHLWIRKIFVYKKDLLQASHKLNMTMIHFCPLKLYFFIDFAHRESLYIGVGFVHTIFVQTRSNVWGGHVK